MIGSSEEIKERKLNRKRGLPKLLAHKRLRWERRRNTIKEELGKERGSTFKKTDNLQIGENDLNAVGRNRKITVADKSIQKCYEKGSTTRRIIVY